MGSSFSRAWTAMIHRNDRRCLLVGLDNAGKTTVMYTLCQKSNVETVPTIGFNVETVKIKNLSLDIWDVGGQDKYRSTWRHYYTGTHGVIFVIDSSDRNRFEQAKLELNKMAIDGQLANACWLILANKQDLPKAARSAEMETILDLSK